MPTVEEMLRPYVEASTVEEAEEALDRLMAEWPAPDHVLGDCYDELAEDAANRKEHDAAVRLERKAIAAGCSDRRLARKMLAWYLLEAGAVDAGEDSVTMSLRCQLKRTTIAEERTGACFVYGLHCAT